MALTVLRICLRNVYTHRYHFFSKRNLSGNPLTEVNSALINEIEREEPSNLQELSYETLISNAQVPFDVNNTVDVLRKLRTHKLKTGIDTKTLISDDRFLGLCKSLEKGYASLKPVQVVMGLRCLLDLGLPPNMKVVEVVENEVLWLSRKMSIKTLCICLDFHSHFEETDQQKNVVKGLVTNINNRWLEIENSFEVISILNNKDYFSEQFVAKVEDKILEFADKITLAEIVSLMTTFSRHKRRPASVLRALSYYLVQKQEALTLRQCSDLCFALSSLNFIDGNILNKVTLDALAVLESNKNGSIVSSLMSSFSLLKWDHSVLLESCCEWVEKNPNVWSKRDLAFLVLSLAHLNYKPEKEQVLFSLVVNVLGRSANLELPPNLWLDFVWALCVVGKVTPQYMASVLDPSFYQSLISDDVPNSIVNKLKLQNINAVSKVEFPLSQIPSLMLPNQPEVPTSAGDQKLRATVVEALKTFLPPPKYLAFNLHSSLGFLITGEFIVDENGNPVPIVDYGVKAGNGKELKHLPKNLNRIALQVWGFKDLTAKTSSLTGLNSLSVRLLKKLGYKVVGITYLDCQNLNTTVKLVQYLQQKIKESIAKT